MTSGSTENVKIVSASRVYEASELEGDFGLHHSISNFDIDNLIDIWLRSKCK